MNVEQYLPNGSKTIRDAIAAAIGRGEDMVTVRGNHLIEETVVIPSGMTLMLDGCHLRLADGTFCRMFTNSYVAALDAGTHTSAWDTHIRILGRNGATLDGGNYNGLSERNEGALGMSMTLNNMILFAHLRDFEIAGLTIRNQRWWAVNLMDCSHGHVHDMDFCSNYLRLLPDGTFAEGLLIGDYAATYIKNSDGIDLRIGCHDIVVEHITGFTEDDMVALTALYGDSEKKYTSDRENDGICNVTVRGVRGAAYCTLVRLLNQGGTELHDITVEDVYDDSENCPYLDGSVAHAVRLGDKSRYGEGEDCPAENICIRNVYGTHSVVVAIDGAYRNVSCENVRGNRADQILVRRSSVAS